MLDRPCRGVPMSADTFAERSKDSGAVHIVATKPSRKLVSWAVDLTVESIRPYVHSGCMKFVKGRSLRNKKTRFIFAFEDSAPVGFCAFRLESNTCFIYEIHVHARHRSRSIGTKMLDCVRKHVADLVESIALQVHRRNTRAEAFYAKYGFAYDDTLEASPNYSSMRLFLSGKSAKGL